MSKLERAAHRHYSYSLLLEPFLFAALVGLYIWRLQASAADSWVVFPIWLIVSIAAHRDAPQTLGWRGDNLWPASRQSAIVFAIFIVVICITGLFLGGLHRLPAHLIEPRRFLGYLSFCLLQQVALNSYLTNRLLAALGDSRRAALVSGAIFGALHWPNPVLVPLTFAGGIAMAWLFARQRNIIPLAIGQAILGSLIWWAFPLAWHHSMRVGPGYYSFVQHAVR